MSKGRKKNPCAEIEGNNNVSHISANIILTNTAKRALICHLLTDESGVKTQAREFIAGDIFHLQPNHQGNTLSNASVYRESGDNIGI